MSSFVLVAVLVSVGQRPSPERMAAQQAVQAARSKLQEAEQRWRIGSSNSNFLAQRRELERQRDEYRELPVLRQRKVQELTANSRQRQLERFLDSHRIAAASISGIGPDRKATLQSYGIETAADAVESAVLKVPGFGPVLTRNLVAWRRSIESRFVFDPRRGIDPADLAAIERDIAAKRAQIEKALRDGPAQLQRTAQQVQVTRATLASAVEQARTALAQAEARLKAM